ncbi:LexA family transcriptional regulator [Desulfosarcina cetonica]|nr:LexA family transcriptional regulator [Desulfosarcina cetonica]
MSNTRKGRQPVQEITAPQLRTLQEIRFFTVEHGFPPTIKELSGALGISHASVHEQINQLVRKGYLKREPRKARGIVIIKEPNDTQP